MEMDVNTSFRSQFNELSELSGGLRFLHSNSDFIPYYIEEKIFDLEEDNDPQIREVFHLNKNIKKIQHHINKGLWVCGVYLFEILLKSENYWISQYGDLIKIKRLPIKLVPIEGQLVYPHDMCALGVGVYKENINATVEIILTNELLDKGVMNEF